VTDTATGMFHIKSSSSQYPHLFESHHCYLHSPWRALAFFRSFVHSSLPRATFFKLLTSNILTDQIHLPIRDFYYSHNLIKSTFQFLTSNILISPSTPFSHRNFSRPTLLTPSNPSNTQIPMYSTKHSLDLYIHTYIHIPPKHGLCLKQMSDS